MLLAGGFLFLSAVVFTLGYVPNFLRGGIYLFGFLATVLGTYACVRIARSSGRRGVVSVFLYTLTVREAALLPVFFVLFNISIGAFDTPDWLGLALLVVSTLGIGLSNFALYYSLRHDVLEKEVDWMPFRSLFRRNG